MKFSEMPYERPDTEKLKIRFAELTETLLKAENFEKADAAFREEEELSAHLETMGSLCYVRHSINTEDKFYEAEQDFYDENNPVFQESLQAFQKALTVCPFRKELEEKYGSLLFTNIDMALRTFKPELIPLMQEENKLTTAYAKLIASAKIPFRGEELTVSELAPYRQTEDDATRHEAWEATCGFFSSHNEEWDSIYDKLVSLRTEMGKKLGYENFIPLGYDRMERNSYTAGDVDAFRAAVREYIVPIADSIYREQAKRTGLPYPLSYRDSLLAFRDGNPKPVGTADDILKNAQDFYHWLSPETSEFVDTMFRDELMDVLSRKGKEAGGYCTSLPDYKVPFVFANFNGTSDDVETMTHEFGHAFAGWSARDIFPEEYQSPTLESCECHSMSMEFFGWAWADKFYGKDQDKFRYSHLAGALTFIPYGTMVDHFQHIVYEKPEMTPAERIAKWKELTGLYMPWIKLDDLPFYGEGRAWQRQSHIYEVPFYYIDYCLAQTVALEFWAEMQSDRKAAFDRYLKLVSLAGTKTFRELLKGAGLEDPFVPETLKRVATVASEWLKDHSI